MEPTTVSLAMLAVTQSVTVFSSLLPPVSEVRKATSADVSVLHDVRTAEFMAAGIVVGIGLVASALTKSPVPAMVAIIGAGALLCMYEGILQKTPTEKATANV